MRFWLLLFSVICPLSVGATGKVEKVALPSIPFLERTDIYSLKLFERPKGILAYARVTMKMALAGFINRTGCNLLERIT